jgi:hypothetical protein
MRTPKTLKLMGRTIKIRHSEEECNREGVFGRVLYRRDEIVIQPVGKENSQQNHDITLLHEILHWILYLTESHKHNEDEGFVGRVSELLYQAIKQLQEDK